jgi:hypothetical protein
MVIDLPGASVKTAARQLLGGPMIARSCHSSNSSEGADTAVLLGPEDTGRGTKQGA